MLANQDLLKQKVDFLIWQITVIIQIAIYVALTAKKMNKD